jgi:hypothetical protein
MHFLLWYPELCTLWHSWLIQRCLFACAACVPAVLADAVDFYLAPSGAVRLLNFAPICATTSPLLFTWEELPYTHMHAASASSPPEQHASSSSSSSSGNGPTATHDAGGNPTQQPDSSSSSGGSHDRGTPPTPTTGSGLPECRLIEQPGLVQAGNVAATGMPYDMLHMQDSLDSIIAAMQRQQQGQA